MSHRNTSLSNLPDSTKLFRIFNLFDFINSLETNTIRLSQVSRMEDPNELFGIYFDLLVSIFGPSCEEEIDNIQKEFSKAQTHHYMTSWTRTHSNIAVWSLYSPNRDAIQVCTTFGSLKKAIDKRYQDYPYTLAFKLPTNDPTDLFMPPTYGKVDYVNFEEQYSELKDKCVMYFDERDAYFKKNIAIGSEEAARDWSSQDDKIRQRIFGKSRHGGPLLKDHRYKHEEEVRFILNLKRRDGRSEEEYRNHRMAPLDDPAKTPDPEACPENIFVPFDSRDFFEIKADGRMDNWKFDVVKTILEKYNKSIKKSDAFSQLRI